MDSELLTCLLKFIAYFPDYLSALSHTLLRFVWTTFVETAVCLSKQYAVPSFYPGKVPHQESGLEELGKTDRALGGRESSARQCHR